MQIPTEEDWRSEAWDQDTSWAYGKFKAKTLDEAIKIVEDNAIGCWDDFVAMPSRVFGCYLRAYMSYLLSGASREDSGAASCFISLIEFRLKHHRNDVILAWNEIEPVFSKLANEQAFFDASWGIYGEFRTKIAEIITPDLPVTFDISQPEMVPSDVTISAMAMTSRSIPFWQAVKVFQNSNVLEITEDTTRAQLEQIFCEPIKSGGGTHEKYDAISEWSHHRHSQCMIRFEFEGQAITAVTFMSLRSMED